MRRGIAPAPFIIGVARSGTTLLRLMLDAHPEVAIPPETHFLAQFVGQDRSRICSEEFWEKLVNAPTWPNMGLDPCAFREALAAVEPFTVTEGGRAFFSAYAAKFSKKRWGDKTPPYRNCIAGLAAFFPEARFIHLIRDGRDVALSYRGLWFGPGDNVARQATFWMTEIATTRAQGKELPYYLEVRYEDLLAAPRHTLERICQFISLDFDPSMLDYYRTASQRLSEFTAPFGPPGANVPNLERFLSIHQNTATPLDLSRAGRWRLELPEADQRSFEAIAGVLLQEQGYETRFQGNQH